MSYQVPDSESSDDLVTFHSIAYSPAPEDTIMGDTQPTGGLSAQSASHAVFQEQLRQLFNELQELRQENNDLQA